MPVVWRARGVSQRQVPRLSGSDLIEPLLDAAQTLGLRFGVLGGSSEAHAQLEPVLSRRWPQLTVAGLWSPSREALDDPHGAAEVAAEIRWSRVDMLMVCLGKPRQERWIATYAPLAGVRTALAFGGTVDFLAGRVPRAPATVSNVGLEWAWRLSHEPRRLARRYLLQGPPAALALWSGS